MGGKDAEGGVGVEGRVDAEGANRDRKPEWGLRKMGVGIGDWVDRKQDFENRG